MAYDPKKSTEVLTQYNCKRHCGLLLASHLARCAFQKLPRGAAALLDDRDQRSPEGLADVAERRGGEGGGGGAELLLGLPTVVQLHQRTGPVPESGAIRRKGPFRKRTSDAYGAAGGTDGIAPWVRHHCGGRTGPVTDQRCVGTFDH